mmetsp:Transcript_37582/g.94904  ORF Transcript_37582/g.94904 Transcript_37582/m.94904 type:complete len:133 (+) Transcript_37582:2880-3278(+)
MLKPSVTSGRPSCNGRLSSRHSAVQLIKAQENLAGMAPGSPFSLVLPSVASTTPHTSTLASQAAAVTGLPPAPPTHHRNPNVQPGTEIGHGGCSCSTQTLFSLRNPRASDWIRAASCCSLVVLIRPPGREAM